MSWTHKSVIYIYIYIDVDIKSLSPSFSLSGSVSAEGFAQACSDLVALALKLLLSCTKPLSIQSDALHITVILTPAFDDYQV